MTNLEYMKQSIFNQINAMTAEDFYSFMYLLADNNDSNSLDLSGMLTCDDCKNTYGPCDHYNQGKDSVKKFTAFTLPFSLADKGTDT